MEKMNEFFTARADGYDEHMLSNVKGCKEAYKKMAELVPKTTTTLLDLGCGTGLELDEIFKLLPRVSVTGIDLTQAMLNKLKQKHPDKTLKLICNSYFDVDLGISSYDCVISFQTMHHFNHKTKIAIYKKIRNALKDNGMYIECDYMVTKQEDEDNYYAENSRIRKELNISPKEFYHYDTPCTIDNQILMFKKAEFTKVEKVFCLGNTTIIIGYK